MRERMVATFHLCDRDHMPLHYVASAESARCNYTVIVRYRLAANRYRTLSGLDCYCVWPSPRLGSRVKSPGVLGSAGWGACVALPGVMTVVVKVGAGAG